MSEPIVYIDHSEIVEGKLKDLQEAVNGLVELFRAREPRLIAYHVYFSEDGKRMSILHVHPDSESLELHLTTFAPRAPEFKELVRLLSIDIYGAVSDQVLLLINQKAVMLGIGNVRVHKLHKGFSRFSTRYSAPA